MNFVSSLIHDALIALPYVLALAGFYLFLKTVYHVKTPVRPLFLWPIVCALLGTGVFMIWAHHHIAASGQHQWWLGHGFFPLYAVAVALAGYVIAWILFYVFRFLLERLRLLSMKLKHPR